MNNRTTTLLLVLGIVILANLIFGNMNLRLDFTENGQYSLSTPTKDIISNLDQPITISFYATDDLPAQLLKTKEDFENMLIEYASRSKGYIDYQIISPETEEQKQEAQQDGIGPIMINVREKDQAIQKQIFLGAVINMGEQKEVIPLIQPGTSMEYSLSTSIKKLSVIDKPVVGFILGHGEPTLDQFGQAIQELSILYNVEPIDLNTATTIDQSKFKAVVLAAPTDTIPPAHFAVMDNYLGSGGRMFVALNRVTGDFQSAQGTVVSTGVETWLQQKGVEVEGNFLIDAQCGSVSVQQRNGYFSFSSQVQFPFFPIISNFMEHPITKGIEQVILQFASPVRYLGDSTIAFTPIAYSSEKAGTINAPTFFDVNRKWGTNDFPLNQVPVAGILEGILAGNTPSKMVVVSDGDFAVSGQQGQRPNNISFMVNGIDWLSDDTGLIALRTKSVDSRPIDSEYMTEEASGTRNLIKYLNFGLPILLVIGYGVLRSQQQRSKQIKRMQESYA